MRAIWSVRPKCSHRCVSLKETPLKPVQILKRRTFTQPSKPLWERNGLNISRFKLFRCMHLLIKSFWPKWSFGPFWAILVQYTFRQYRGHSLNEHTQIRKANVVNSAAQLSRPSLYRVYNFFSLCISHASHLCLVLIALLMLPRSDLWKLHWCAGAIPPPISPVLLQPLACRACRSWRLSARGCSCHGDSPRNRLRQARGGDGCTARPYQKVWGTIMVLAECGWSWSIEARIATLYMCGNGAICPCGFLSHLYSHACVKIGHSPFEPGVSACRMVEKDEHLVSHCSATGDSVAATPGVARHHLLILTWPTSGATPPPTQELL